MSSSPPLEEDSVPGCDLCDPPLSDGLSEEGSGSLASRSGDLGNMALTPFLGGDHRNAIMDPESSYDNILYPAEPFSNLDRPFFGRDFGGGIVGTRVDWVETPEAHVFKADIPGTKKDELLVVVVDGRMLSISGDRKEERFEEEDSWRRMERSYGKFSRQIGLPQNSNPAEVVALMENGVLTITVLKAFTEATRVRVIDVQYI